MNVTFHKLPKNALKTKEILREDESLHAKFYETATMAYIVVEDMDKGGWMFARSFHSFNAANKYWAETERFMSNGLAD